MYIRKRNGRYTVEIHKQGFKRIIKTFAQKSDARKFGIDTEVQMERKRYKDISNASKTTLRAVLERHLNELMLHPISLCVSRVELEDFKEN